MNALSLPSVADITPEAAVIRVLCVLTRYSISQVPTSTTARDGRPSQRVHLL